MPPPAKKSKLSHAQTEEIVFDPSARQDYLTGFHKRKVARIEHARDAAAKRAREEKLNERRQIREQRKEELDNHVKSINAELKKLNEDSSESEAEERNNGDGQGTGLEASEQTDGQEEEYVDEDKYTTVTVEAMGESSDDEEEAQDDGSQPGEAEKESAVEANNKSPTSKKRVWTKAKPIAVAGSVKRKKKKFRYESKAERKEVRLLQKAKKLKAAKARRDRQS